MGGKRHYDFGGWATRNDIECSDGRTIRKDAFIDNDGMTVPLVWGHRHESPDKVLGHCELKNCPEGVYTYGYFNDTPQGKNAKALVMHGDIGSLSIYANQLQQLGTNVMHGQIREVSLVLAGANPGAYIDDVMLHGEGVDAEAVIYTGLPLELYVEEASSDAIEHADELKKEESKEEASPKKVSDIVETMNDEQKEALYALIGAALEDGAEDDTNEEGEETEMKHNVFDNNENVVGGDELMHADDILAISDELCHTAFKDVRNYGGSFRDSFLAHAEGDYGIGNIELLFPDAKALDSHPEFIKREDEWVSTVINGTKHLPFSRVKTLFADITEDDARALGYLEKGQKKKEEFFSLAKRETQPTTIYKKQKLDRQDIIDATTMDVVSWLWTEMRIMLNEEIARAILIGDGRSAVSQDKINEECIRPIVSSEDLFCVKKNFTNDEAATADTMIEAMSKAHRDYRGSGAPIMFMAPSIHSDMLWVRDNIGRRLYTSDAELCSVLRVSSIVDVPLMEDLVVSETVSGVTTSYDIYAIKVALKDYSVGTDKGGEITTFDDFDIDYNQYKYLIEGRMSGALTKWHCAQVFRKARS
jgi:hypothetical protein